MGQRTINNAIEQPATEEYSLRLWLSGSPNRMTTFERLARAMFAVDHDESWGQGEALTKEIYLSNTRALLTELMEPGKDVYCQNSVWSKLHQQKVLRAMIQAILDEADNGN